VSNIGSIIPRIGKARGTTMRTYNSGLATPIGPARTARALEPQPIDQAQEILANAPIAPALAVARRIGRQTDRRALANRLATGRPPTETERPGTRDKVGRRDVRQEALLLEPDNSGRLPEGRGWAAGDSEQPHSTAVAEDSEAVVAGDSAAAEAAVAGVGRT
jgi:hypothetical protein